MQNEKRHTSRLRFGDSKLLTDDGRWLLQPGVWGDHPDFQYAGHDSAEPDPATGSLPPAPVDGIGWDTGHAHRLPLWLRSLEAAAVEPDDVAFIRSVRAGLERQFFERVLIRPDADADEEGDEQGDEDGDRFDGFRTTNYLSGHDGLYRYGYRNRSGRDGLPFRYEPGEVSSTLMYGWWTFLDTDRTTDLYREISESFPLSQQTLDVYTGPAAARQQHPLLHDGAFLTNGFSELFTLLAAQRWSTA